MSEDYTIHIWDKVMDRNEPGVFTVVQTRHTAGIPSPDDELCLQKDDDEADVRWRKRSDLLLLRKAGSSNDRR